MEFWWLLLVVFILTLGTPYIRYCSKRIIMARGLSKLCKANGYTLYPTHLFWLFGRKNATECDIYIETNKTLFSIKLFGVSKKRSVLVFTDKGKYYIRSFLALINVATVIYSLDGSQKNLPEYDFRAGFKPEWETKRHRNILLINPICREINLQYTHGKKRILGNGEFIGNCEISNLSGLISELERENEQSTATVEI